MIRRCASPCLRCPPSLSTLLVLHIVQDHNIVVCDSASADASSSLVSRRTSASHHPFFLFCGALPFLSPSPSDFGVHVIFVQKNVVFGTKNVKQKKKKKKIITWPSKKLHTRVQYTQPGRNTNSLQAGWCPSPLHGAKHTKRLDAQSRLNLLDTHLKK